jgi:coenzyme PQQ biosynthesis protein PqqD
MAGAMMDGSAAAGENPERAADLAAPASLSEASRPRLAAKARLRQDRRTGGYLLLYPEKGLALNGTATEVVRLCTGEHTVGAIVEALAGKYAGQPRATIEAEVLAFLGSLADRGLLEPEGRAS